MDIYHLGAIKYILYCDGAMASRQEAEAAVPRNGTACIAQLDRLLERLGDVGKLNSPTQFNHEGNGIYAVKTRCGLRAYGWLGNHEGQASFFISHFIMKKRQKLDVRDLERAVNNRTTYEEGRNGN